MTFGIVLAFGYPVATALTVSASLAQIGEFSFILAGLGVVLGLLPAEGRDLILAGALLSITLNPLVFAALDRLGVWLRQHPQLTARLERQGCEVLRPSPTSMRAAWRITLSSSDTAGSAVSSERA